MTTADPEQIWKSEKCVSSFHLPFIWLFCLWFVLPFFGQTTSHLTLVPDVVISKISEDWFLISLKTQLRVSGGAFSILPSQNYFYNTTKSEFAFFFPFVFLYCHFPSWYKAMKGKSADMLSWTKTGTTIPVIILFFNSLHRRKKV